MKSTSPLPQTMWIPSALVLVLLAGCRETKYSTVELERFGDSATGSGRVRYAEKSYGGYELTIELGLLQPGEDYWLCLNAAFPDSPENTIIGELEFEDWPKGGFYDDNKTGKKEGFWDFAKITADKNGTFKASSGNTLADEDIIEFSTEDHSTNQYRLTLKMLDSAGKPIPTCVILTYAKRIDINVYCPPSRVSKAWKQISLLMTYGDGLTLLFRRLAYWTWRS